MIKRFVNRVSLFVFIGILMICAIDLVCKEVIKIPHKQAFLNVEKMDALFDKINNNSILFVGDSRLEWGIKPLVIDSVLKNDFTANKCLNLAMINNNGLSTMEYLIKQKKVPSVLVYNHNIINYQYKNLVFNEYTSSLHRQLVNFKNKVEDTFIQNTYVLEPKFESINNYLDKNVSIYLKVRYDESGGCNVWQTNDYENKKSKQVSGYKDPIDTFKYDRFMNYITTLNSQLDYFQKNGATIVLINMPICDDLKKIETLDTTKAAISGLYRNYQIDYTSYAEVRNIKEQEFFFDGSHISRSYSQPFSVDVAKELMAILSKRNTAK